LKTAVALIVFNRPECAARTLAAIREVRPPRLFIIADGPRANRQADLEQCAAVRKLVEEGVDWPCEVERDYAVQNLGCATRLATGLTWAFSRAERLIVLEDDCMPDPSFFWFCEELLERYADDSRIGQICGCPRHFSEIRRQTSYIFSRYGPCWGWASWRRAWTGFDLLMESWPRFLESGALDAIVQSPAELEARISLYGGLHNSRSNDVWDFQWGYAKMSQGMLSVIPCRNLILNIGFGGEGTHYGKKSKFGLSHSNVERPLRHPEFVLPDSKFDKAFSKASLEANATAYSDRAIRKFRQLAGIPISP
jgi:hypothetical protein